MTRDHLISLLFITATILLLALHGGCARPCPEMPLPPDSRKDLWCFVAKNPEGKEAVFCHELQKACAQVLDSAHQLAEVARIAELSVCRFADVAVTLKE